MHNTLLVDEFQPVFSQNFQVCSVSELNGVKSFVLNSTDFLINIIIYLNAKAKPRSFAVAVSFTQ